MSRRVVIACWGSYGDLYPYVGLAKALRALGNEVRLAAPAFYRPTVEQEGIDFAPLGPDVDPGDRETIVRVLHPVRGIEAIVCGLLMPALRQSYEELRQAALGADLLISHPITFAAPVLAEKQGLPWVSTVLAPLSFFSASDFPVLPAAPWLVRLRWLGPWLARSIVRLAHRGTTDWMDPLYKLRAELGLPRHGHPLFEGQFSPWMTLALFSHVMATPQHDWPPHVHVTGFVFYNGPDALDPALVAFLDAGPPPVVFTLGSSAVLAAGRFYQESAEAAARLGVRAVLLTGGIAENQPRGALSSEVFTIDRAPHQLLFPRASAIVHQGGIGTTAQALRSGHPMLVVPHAHDQPDNAFRVTRLGVARTVFPAKYKAERVARELGRLFKDTTYAERSAAAAAVVREEGGADAAAAAINKLR